MAAEPRRTKLVDFLREVFNWTWEEFAKAEKDKNYSSTESIIFAVVRACAMQKMDAIKISLDRLDGKLKTPVQIEYPKIFYRYPNAKFISEPDNPVTDLSNTLPTEKISAGADAPTPPALTGELVNLVEPEPESEEEDLTKMGLRDTLDKMADYPRELPDAIVQRALEVEQAIRNHTPMPTENPRVKSVVAAHLLVMAQKRNIDALYTVFDQIDGRLTETIQILGPGETNQIFINNYSSVAPPGAIPGPDGVLQLEATEVQNNWEDKLKGYKGGR